MISVAQTVGANVRRLRRSRGLSLIELGQHAGLAKGTLTQLEAGRGNPTVDTVQALGRALGVSVGDLVTEPPDSAPRVIRADQGTPIAGWSLEARLINRDHTAGAIMELYGVRLAAGTIQRSPAHLRGVVEQLYVLRGKLEVGPEDARVTLGPHDFVRFEADQPHRYGAPEDAVSALLLMVFPSFTADRAAMPADRPEQRQPPRTPPPRAPTRGALPQIPVRGTRPPTRTPPGGGRRTDS